MAYTLESIKAQIELLLQLGEEKTGLTNSDLTTVVYELLDGYGLNAEDATALAENILEGKTAYVKGGKVTGTIPTYRGDVLPSLVSYTVENNESGGQTYTITSSSYALESDSTDGTTYIIGG